MNTAWRMSESTPHIVIIGGGITGLSAAWELQNQALPVRYTLLEAGDRWGGKIVTERVETLGQPAFIIEGGPDAFLTRKPQALALAKSLGLENQIVGINRANAKTFVLHRGQPVPLPDGLQLLAPTKLWPFLRSPIFSPWGKLRALLDWVLPPRRETGDETLASFVRRRLGREILERVAEPMLAGIYNSRTEEQSIQATFPQFPALERSYGSVIRGICEGAKRAPAPGSAPPAFISFNTGTQALVEALESQLTGNLRLHSAVETILQDGNQYAVKLVAGETLVADAVIVATPARVAAQVLRQAAPETAAGLEVIRFSSIGTISLAFHRDDIPHPLNGLGMVISSREKRCIDGMSWTTSKWHDRAPREYALIRVFFGGPHTREMMQHDNQTLLRRVREELGEILGISTPPVFHRIHRWTDAYPQYDLGHLERVAQIEAALPRGLSLAGSSYRGVGVPDCIQQGQTAAQNALTHLDIKHRSVENSVLNHE